MFPLKYRLKDVLPDEMLTIYIGKTATIAVLLTSFDRFAYLLGDGQTLTVRIKNLQNYVIWSHDFTSEDVREDGLIVFEVDATDTAEFSAGRYIIDGYVDDKIVITPKAIAVKEV